MKLALAVVLTLATTAAAQIHTRVLLGQNGSGWVLGNAVAPTADLDGDGFPDLVVGEVATGVGQSGVALVSGRSGAIFRLSTTGTSWGSTTEVQSVAGLSDVDGDGIAEYAVGLPHFATGAFTAPGAVKVFSGATGAVLMTVVGGATGDLFGWSVTAIGDQDGDGVGDLVVGAPQGETLPYGGDPGFGYVRVVSGATGATIRTLAAAFGRDYLGTAVARLGDLDGDGTEDFAAGAPEQMTYNDNYGILPPLSGGYVQVISGATGSLLFTVSLTGISPAYPGFGGLGYALAPAGDVNGDGFMDLVAGAPGASLAFVLSGSTGAVLSTLVPPPQALQLFGASVGGGGDLNGDGVLDVVVGAPGYANPAISTSPIGRAFVFSAAGALHGMTDGTYGGSWFGGGRTGVAVAMIGDQNGDGFAEVAICSAREAGYVTGSLRIAGLAVADSYGQAGATYPLALGWTHVAGSIGSVALAGAPAGASGLIVASVAPASVVLGGVPVLVDLTPGSYASLPLSFPAGGSVSGLVDLRTPGLAGWTAYLQGAALPAAGLPLVSNGLSLSFAP